MTTEIMLAIAVGASLILNAMQASKAQWWRNKTKDLTYQIDILTRPLEDEEAVHLRDPLPGGSEVDDWLRAHPGVKPKPGYERKRR